MGLSCCLGVALLDGAALAALDEAIAPATSAAAQPAYAAPSTGDGEAPAEAAWVVAPTSVAAGGDAPPSPRRRPPRQRPRPGPLVKVTRWRWTCPPRSGPCSRFYRPRPPHSRPGWTPAAPSATPGRTSRRLLRGPRARRLFRATVRRFLGRRRRRRRVALDSTGQDCSQASRSDVRRRHGASKAWQTVVYSHYAKPEAALDCASHLLVGVLVGRGPRADAGRFVPLPDAARENVRRGAALADAGYDSKPDHRHARERRGVRSCIPAKIGRPTAKPPTGRYRRRMRRRLDKDYGSYGQRAQAESGFSRFKRRLGPTVRGRG